jgi:hypothetical protein
MICRKPHVAGSICLRANIFQNPEGILWTHCTLSVGGRVAGMAEMKNM